ncbi:MAG: hypothetical protein K8R69_09800, partial [Deltaproteobacteria bacterium]|nr:hypothetical protein [Deltaproteobacteria bacterium]
FSGGIELPIERELKQGESMRLKNSQSKEARLWIERGGLGGLWVRLENHEGFNVQKCKGADPSPPGVAHGQGLGKSCRTYGIEILLPGEIQGVLAKINLDDGIHVSAEDGKIQYRTSQFGAFSEIDGDTAVQLRLPAGASLEVRSEAPESHQSLGSDGRILYHLAEAEASGPDLGAVKVFGTLEFTAEFEVSGQGDTHFVREVRPGDLVRVGGGLPNENFVFVAEESQGGALLKISRIGPEQPLRWVQINDEAVIALREDSTVAIASKGGEAAYQNSAADLPVAMQVGKNLMVQSGEVLKIALFTTIHGDQNFAPQPKDNPGLAGPHDFANPSSPPTPEPSSSPEVSALPDGKDVVPGDLAGSGQGGWSCRMNVTSGNASAPAMVFLLLPWITAWLCRRKQP